MASPFPCRKGYKVFVTELGVRENADLDLQEGLAGVIIGSIKERDYVLQAPYRQYLVRFPHGSYFLLRDHFMTEKERDATDSK